MRRIAIVQPICVTGLARSGTMIVLELIAAQAGVVTHRYADDPLIFTLFWWEQIGRAGEATGHAGGAHARGRHHATPESPEALEEVLWMAFFPDADDPAKTNVVDAWDACRRVQTFYRDHIRKLLLCRGGRRYAAKGNYNLTGSSTCSRSSRTRGSSCRCGSRSPMSPH